MINSVRPLPTPSSPWVSGTPVGHPMDHYSGYLITILRFIGLNPIFVASITTATGPEATSASLRTAHEAIDRLTI